MMRFSPGIALIATRDLWIEIGVLARIAGEGSEHSPMSKASLSQASISKCLTEMLHDPREHPFSPNMVRKVERFRARVDEGEIDVLETLHLLKALHDDVLTEFMDPCFLVVPEAHRWLYEQKTPAFGQLVDDQFPDAKRDIAAAARCYALDEWTACVFHLMRIAELGIHELAAWLDVDLAQGATEQWKTALDQIEKAVRAMEQLPKTPQKTADTTFYSEAVAQFRWFKDAWRNHVSHGRTHYDGREAKAVWDHVLPFVNQLAAHKASKS